MVWGTGAADGTLPVMGWDHVSSNFLCNLCMFSISWGSKSPSVLPALPHRCVGPARFISSVKVFNYANFIWGKIISSQLGRVRDNLYKAEFQRYSLGQNKKKWQLTTDRAKADPVSQVSEWFQGRIHHWVLLSLKALGKCAGVWVSCGIQEMGSRKETFLGLTSLCQRCAQVWGWGGDWGHLRALQKQWLWYVN